MKKIIGKQDGNQTNSDGAEKGIRVGSFAKSPGKDWVVGRIIEKKLPKNEGIAAISGKPVSGYRISTDSSDDEKCGTSGQYNSMDYFYGP
ncbi:MAG: hypothetical protein V1822_03510 [Candidatus Micrarchaeota archaeon]